MLKDVVLTAIYGLLIFAASCGIATVLCGPEKPCHCHCAKCSCGNRCSCPAPTGAFAK